MEGFVKTPFWLDDYGDCVLVSSPDPAHNQGLAGWGLGTRLIVYMVNDMFI